MRLAPVPSLLLQPTAEVTQREWTSQLGGTDHIVANLQADAERLPQPRQPQLPCGHVDEIAEIIVAACYVARTDWYKVLLQPVARPICGESRMV